MDLKLEPDRAPDPAPGGPRRHRIVGAVDWFIPDAVRDGDPDTLRRMRMLVAASFVAVPFILLAAYQLYLVGGSPVMQATAAGLGAFLVLTCPLLLKLLRSHVIAGTVLCFVFIGVCFVLAFTDAGLEDPILFWCIPVPLLAAFLVGPRLSTAVAVTLAAMVLALYWLEATGYPFPNITPQASLQWFTMLAASTAVVFMALLSWVYEGYTIKGLRQMNQRLEGLHAALERSEERYRSLFDNVPVGLYRSTPQGRVVIANASMAAILGFDSVASLSGADLERGGYEDPERRRHFRELMDRDGEVTNFESAWRTRDGRLVYLCENARATRDEDGRILYYEGTVEDITARREAQDAQRQSEERFRALVQQSNDTITVVDPEGIVRYQTPSIRRVLGYDAEEIVGRPVFELIHPDDRRRLQAVFERALPRHGEFGTFEIRCRHASGQFVYLESVATNLLTTPGIHGIVLNSRDVTDRKRAEEALVRAKDQAEEVARMKSAFLANMSHEIRTPLTGIIGFANVLADEVSEEHREFTRLIEQSGRRLLDTLNSVLTLARLETDEVDLDLQTMDLTAFTREAVALLIPIAEHKQIALRLVLPREAVPARVDAGCLNRVLNNLIGNAVKFTETGAVTVEVRPDGEHVCLVVRDTGVGIAPEFMPHLFDEFKQESTGLGRTYEGGGLGLTITRRLVELMQGSIQVESVKGEGSTFTVRLPRADAPRITRAATYQTRPVALARRPRLLVVDDNEDTRRLMQRIVQRGFDVDTAGSAAAALAQAGEQRYDAVMMDINLGESVTGVDVMQRMRQIPGYRAVPVVAFTAYALPGDRERFLNAGFDAYLSKPFTADQLFAILDEILPSGDSAPASLTLVPVPAEP
jgi:PAS domain S-box-containing protein